MRWKEQPTVCSNYFATDEAPPHKPPNPIPIPANKGVTPITEAILYAESSGILLGATPDVRERFSRAGGAIGGEGGGTTTAKSPPKPTASTPSTIIEFSSTPVEHRRWLACVQYGEGGAQYNKTTKSRHNSFNQDGHKGGNI